jgi:hypothetical protein
MKLRRLVIAGFRGINSERTIDLHDKLTVISAPNSYGKTSISEALEFLIYGTTSKVERAQSKEEYKDSFRNRHYPGGQAAYVVVDAHEAGGAPTTLRIELDANGAVRRSVDGANVSQWPFKSALDVASRPFILQHALKNLLLVPPAERFQGFAQLLGLDEVERVHAALLSLCTKPESDLPPEASSILESFENLRAHLAAVPSLTAAVSSLKAGHSGLAAAYSCIENRADSIIGKSTATEERLANLLQARAGAVAKVFSGSVALSPSSVQDAPRVAAARQTLQTAVTSSFLDNYARLASRDTAERLRQETQLLDIGVRLLDGDPGRCPLCQQPLGGEVERHLRERHAETMAAAKRPDPIKDATTQVTATLQALRGALGSHRSATLRRSVALLESVSATSRKAIESILGTSVGQFMPVLDGAADTIRPLFEHSRKAANEAEAAIAVCEEATRMRVEEIAQAEALARAIDQYLASADGLRTDEDRHEASLLGVEHRLQRGIDQIAGTTELSLLVDLIEKRPVVAKAVRILDLLDEVRQLRKPTEQTLGETMEAAMSADLTTAVMTWYKKIRTLGDPDVHFAGFAMEKTKGGAFKSRRLAVKAASYGVELASAVSSLSESKLNALGLCVSIASAIRAPGPWGFLIVDDPIQSWDDEHEMQFISILRDLVEAENKQVIVLTHKRSWADAVCDGCRSLNGYRYDITGYVKDGPSIIALDWDTIEQRIREAESITDDPNATPIRQQQAEEEVRIAACQLAARVAAQRLGYKPAPHKMNAADVRAILTKAGMEADVIDRIGASSSVADDAHHAPDKYTPNRQRVRRALVALREVLKVTKMP